MATPAAVFHSFINKVPNQLLDKMLFLINIIQKKFFKLLVEPRCAKMYHYSGE